MAAMDLISTGQLSSTLFQIAHYGAFDLELKFDPKPTMALASRNWIIPFVCVSAYLIFLYTGTKAMEKLVAFDLRYKLALWNLSLSLFSFCGAFRTVRDLYYFIFMFHLKTLVFTYLLFSLSLLFKGSLLDSNLDDAELRIDRLCFAFKGRGLGDGPYRILGDALSHFQDARAD